MLINVLICSKFTLKDGMYSYTSDTGSLISKTIECNVFVLKYMKKDRSLFK